MKHATMKIFFLLLLLIPGITVFAQQREYKGSVKEADGLELPGVNIIIENTTRGTTSNLDGLFTIQASPGEVLTFTYIGFEPVELTLGDQTQLNVVMKMYENMLEEMVVVGYGQMKKSDLTAAISSVKSEDLVKTSITSLDQGLQGRVSGVVVTSTSGQPGGGTSIRIRGTSSIMGTNEPLYVIDGVPMIGEGSGGSGVLHSPSLNPMANINPSDVESIEVLKDASATAIYGARGANGVILVTTKRGSQGKVRVSANAYFGIQQIANTMKMLNAEQLAILGNEAADNANQDRKLIFADLNNLRKRSTDWQKEIFRLAPIQNYELTFSGGGESSKYFLSANYFSQDGIILGSDYQKGNLRFNLDQDITSRLKIGTSVNMTYNVSHGVVTNYETAFASSITSWALEMNPGLPVYNEDGSYVYENNTSKPAVGNPVQDANEYMQRTKSGRVLANIFGELDIYKGLGFRTSLGLDYFNIKDQSFASKDIKRGESNNGNASVGNAEGYIWVWENTFKYNHTFAGKHTVDAVAGITAQKYVTESSAIAVSDIEDGRLGYNSIQSAAKTQLANTNYTASQMLSYLARVNYAYDSRYLLTLTGRVDGSSKFGAKNKYGFFPSVAVAWRISEEAFMEKFSNLDNLKLRFSYGLVGNEGIAPYSSQGLLWNTEAYIYDNKIITGQGTYSLDNKALKWETTRQLNLGFDLSLFNRLHFTFDAYHKKTSDLLLFVPVAYHMGYDFAMQNVGDMENKGFDITLNGTPVNTKKFQWDSGFTFGLNRNKVTKLMGAEEGLIGSSIAGISYWTKITEGKPIGTLYGYKTDGIAQLNEDLSTIPYFPGRTINYGDRKYVDKDGSKSLDEGDLYELGNANPDFSYGWNNTFSLNMADKGNLNLTVYLQGVYGNKIANFNKFALESFDGTKNNSTVALERWTPDNPTNKYPRANASPMSNVMSDHQIEDGSYLRVKDVTLSYDFPKQMLKKMRLSALQISVSAKNLYTFTNYSGYDPEVSRFGANNLSMGADYGTYPMPKLYTVGLKVNF